MARGESVEFHALNTALAEHKLSVPSAIKAPIDFHLLN